MTNQPPSLLRSVLAICAGYATLAGVSAIGSYAILLLIRGSNLPLVNAGMSVVGALAGGFITAWAAGRMALRHAAILAAFVLVISLIAALEASSGPARWYPIGLAVALPVMVIAGAWLKRPRA